MKLIGCDGQEYKKKRKGNYGGSFLRNVHSGEQYTEGIITAQRRTMLIAEGGNGGTEKIV